MLLRPVEQELHESEIAVQGFPQDRLLHQIRDLPAARDRLPADLIVLEGFPESGSDGPILGPAARVSALSGLETGVFLGG